MNTIKKNGIHYLADKSGNIKQISPWLEGTLSEGYDTIMQKSIFPKLLYAGIHEHVIILHKELDGIHNQKVLELGTGSGTLANILPNDNYYIGIDITKELLEKAIHRFQENGFENFKLYNIKAEKLPFEKNTFDFAICNLSLNFFEDVNLAVQELYRTLKVGATFLGNVPIAERKPNTEKMRGNLFSESELKNIFEKHNFIFESKEYKNGAILYFSATKKKRLF